jgi:signal transduction histidine kinase
LLSVIRMSNQLIARTVKDNAEVKEYTTDIEKASVQGKTVVRSMLGYARDESVTDEPMDVNEVIENTVSLLNKEFLRGIQLTLELSQETQPVAIHQGRLEQILLNLIVNASEAMRGRGKLKIASHLRSSVWEREVILRPRGSEKYVELTVSDSGPGIPQEIIGRIFEPFFSTKRSASTPGTGLGLSLVYSIAQEDGLGLSVESSPGAGASFAILIPVAGNDTSPVRQMHISKKTAL